MKQLFLLFAVAILLSCSNSGNQQNADASDSTKSKTDSTLVATAEFKVSGMTCTGCENSIQTNVGKLDGIITVKASHTLQTAVVTFDSTKVSTSQIAEAITNTGYTVEEQVK